MARLKVQFTGDAKDVQRAAQEASQAMTAAQAQMVAATKQADAASAASAKEAQAARVEAAKKTVEAQRDMVRAATGEEKQWTRVALEQARERLKAEQQALRDLTAARRAADAAVKASSRDAANAVKAEAQAQRQAFDDAMAPSIQRAKDAAANAAKVAGGNKPAEAGESVDPLALARGVLKVVAVFGTLAAVAVQLTKAMQEQARELANAKADAGNTMDAIAEQVGFSGAAGDARSMARDYVKAGAGRLTPSQITDAFKATIAAGGNLAGKEADIMAALSGGADARNFEGILGLLAQGQDAGGARLIADDFYNRSRGQRRLEAAGASDAAFAWAQRTGVQDVAALRQRSATSVEKDRQAALTMVNADEQDDRNAVNRMRADATAERRRQARAAGYDGTWVDAAGNVISNGMESLGVDATLLNRAGIGTMVPIPVTISPRGPTTN